MPSITIADFILTDEVKKSTSPDGMINTTFRDLSHWFAQMIPKLEGEWKKRIPTNETAVTTHIALGGLASEVTHFGSLLVEFTNKSLNPKPMIGEVQFISQNIPSEAKLNSPNDAHIKIAKTFQALKPWFDDILFKGILPVYKLIITSSNGRTTGVLARLQFLVGCVNAAKSVFMQWVNDQIAQRERSHSFRALAETEAPATFSPEVAHRIVSEVLGVEVGGNEPPDVSDEMAIDLEDFVLG
ncbi:hypothetical protein V8F06_013957 [Rhypophila decipiens]